MGSDDLVKKGADISRYLSKYISDLKDSSEITGPQAQTIGSFVSELEEIIQKQNQLVQKRERRLKQISWSLSQSIKDGKRDSLTKLYNRQETLEYFKRIKGNKRSNDAHGFMILDLDDFKKVNDTYGHQAGDYVLRQCAKAAEGVVRSTDRVGRYGGEELIVALPATDHEGALRVAEKIRKAINTTVSAAFNDYIKLWELGEQRETISCSIGVATSVFENRRGQLILYADNCLLEAKKAGKNQVKGVCIYGPYKTERRTSATS